MKKSYSVKETAILLGVSTNTIYTYLKEGKLIGRRIGKGRFKIPYLSLLPFIDTGNLNQGYSEKSDNSLQMKSNSENNEDAVGGNSGGVNDYSNLPNNQFKTNENQNVDNSDEQVTTTGYNDVYFYRLFKAIMLLGVGVIYLIMKDFPNFASVSVFDKNTDLLFVKLLPFALIISGLMSLSGILFSNKLNSFQGIIHLFTVFILGYYSLIALFLNDYGLLVFILSLFAVTLIHIISGLNNNRNLTFFSQFSKYSLFLSLIGGVVIILYPDFFPIHNISNIISQNKGLSAMIWYGIFIPVLIVLINKVGKPRYLSVIYFLTTGIFSLILSNYLGLKADWDVSYLSFMTGIFALFFAFWQYSFIRVEVRKTSIFVIVFSWIAISIICGLYSMRFFRSQVLNKDKELLNSKLTDVVVDVTNLFENQSTTLVSYASDQEVIDYLRRDNNEILTQKAKELYEKTSLSQRVIFYDEKGKSIAIYPHLKMGLGVYFSEREYFINTKISNKGYISNVFENILGTYTIMQTEPIFYDNKFAGMVSVALSLKDLSEKYKRFIGNEFNIMALDNNNAVVFASDTNKIGSILQSDELKNNFGKESIWLSQKMRNPNWEIYIDAFIPELIGRNSSTNMLIYILLVFNSVVSIWIAFTLSDEKFSINPFGLKMSTLVNG